LGELTESSALSVALFKLYIDNVTRNPAKMISGAKNCPYTQELKKTTKAALRDMKSAVEFMNLRVLIISEDISLKKPSAKPAFLAMADCA